MNSISLFSKNALSHAQMKKVTGGYVPESRIYCNYGEGYEVCDKGDLMKCAEYCASKPVCGGCAEMA